MISVHKCIFWTLLILGIYVHLSTQVCLEYWLEWHRKWWFSRKWL